MLPRFDVTISAEPSASESARTIIDVNWSYYWGTLGTSNERFESQWDVSGFVHRTWGRATGEAAEINPFRYSTKYQDYTGLYYYGFRFYSPSQGRFLNRDPIEEAGGLNLYAFVGNDPINTWDFLGLDFIAVGTRPAVFPRQTIANHMSVEFFEFCGDIEEKEEFDWDNPPEGAEWEGSVELIGHFRDYGRYEQMVMPPRRGPGRGDSDDMWTWVPISFIHFDREEGTRAPDIGVVMYAEDDASGRWEEVLNAARSYLNAEQLPATTPLKNWPHSRYFLPWQGPGINSNTFAREMARVVGRSADITGRDHPGSFFAAPLAPDPPTPVHFDAR